MLLQISEVSDDIPRFRMVEANGLLQIQWKGFTVIWMLG